MERFVRIGCLLAILSVARSGLAASVETLKVKTPRGANLIVMANIPDGQSLKHAAVVIAPGQGYHMDLPILRGLAEKLAANGVVAFRFNWDYFSTNPQKGLPSNDLSKETEDMQAVVDLAKSDARVDPAQIVIIGKSMGSVVAYEVFMKEETAALVLLTPICTYMDNGKAMPSGPSNYPRLPEVSKPVVMALGNADPLCSVPMLYDFIKATKGNVSTVIVGGNHSLELGSASNPDFVRRNAANIDMGVLAVAHWINLILGK